MVVDALARVPRRTQQERSAATRARLLDAAIGCLVEEGYAATTSARVCERAGLTRGAQIHHYPSQSQLVQAAVERLADQVVAAFDAQLASTRGGDPLDAFLEGIWRTLEGPLFPVSLEIMVAARTDAELLRVLQPALERMRVVIAVRVAAIAVAVRPCDPAPVATALEVSVRLVHGVALDALLNGRQPHHDALYAAWKAQVRHLAGAPR